MQVRAGAEGTASSRPRVSPAAANKTLRWGGHRQVASASSTSSEAVRLRVIPMKAVRRIAIQGRGGWAPVAISVAPTQSSGAPSLADGREAEAESLILKSHGQTGCQGAEGMLRQSSPLIWPCVKAPGGPVCPRLKVAGGEHSDVRARTQVPPATLECPSTSMRKNQNRKYSVRRGTMSGSGSLPLRLS